MANHQHDAPASPYFEKRSSPENTEALVERVRKIEALLVAKGIVTPETLDGWSICTRTISVR